MKFNVQIFVGIKLDFTMKLAFWTSVGLCLLFSACKKEEPTPETSTFANSIRMVPNQKQVAVGDTFTISAFYYNSKNEIENVPLQWQVSDSLVANLSNAGLVTALKEGKVNIKASYGNLATATAMFTVTGMASNSNLRTGKISGKNNHVATGTVNLIQKGNALEIMFGTDFSSQSGPELIVYLSNEEKVVSSSLYIAPLAQLSGEHSYTAPLGTNLKDFNYVIIHCKPFNVTFAAALLN